jgi:hypothetical protein
MSKDKESDINGTSSIEAPGEPAAPQLLAGRARKLIREALTTRFAAFLKPGERLDIDAEQSDEYVWATIRVTTVDESFQLDVEASILAADQNESTLSEPARYLELAIEFLKLQLYEFFRQDRDERFHVDWRIYPVEKVTVRFRGRMRMPSLERDADELLGESVGETGDD